MRDIPPSIATHRPNDTHTASLLAQRRTGVRLCPRLTSRARKWAARFGFTLDCLCFCVSRIVASLEAEASALSSVASSQDSLHKQPKKKGIKSSIGRLFGKKEKGRLAHLAHRHVMVDPQGEGCSDIPIGSSNK